MSGRLRALAAVLLVLLTGTTAGPRATAAPTTAAPATCAGVWVTVGDRQGCALEHATGEEALASAGFTVATQGGLVCQIDARPEACVIRNDAYWSYWQSARQADGSYAAWRYSTTGAGTYRPKAGDAEGWVFGAGKEPPAGLPRAGSFQPDAAGAPASTPTPAPAPAAGGPPIATAITAAVIVGGVVALVVALLRRRTS